VEIKNRQKVLLIIAATGVFLLLAESLVLTPLKENWVARSKKIEELKQSVAQGSQLLKRQTVIHDHWEQMKTNTLPNDISLAESGLLKAFDRWSRDSGISISSIKPQWKQNDEDYVTLECRADAAGNMQALSRFIYDVEKDPLALKMEVVEISSHDNDGQQLSLSLQISGLILTPKQQ
jgi:Tfp pilus assembly protein PilO